MKKTLRILKRLLNFVLLVLLFFVVFSIGESVYEHIKQAEKLQEFKSRAYDEIEVTNYGDSYVYHPVKREYAWELADARNVFYDTQKMYPGLKGDILLAFGSPFPYIPVVDQVLSYWLGGHAALVSDNNQVLQSTGMTGNGLLDLSTMLSVIGHRGFDDENKYGVSVQSVSNYWMTPFRSEAHAEYPYYGRYYRPEIYAVRPKFENIDERDEDIGLAVDFAKDKVNRGLYNYLFIFDNENKYYCTDLVTRAYYAVNAQKGTDYNLDEDGFIPSDYDLLLSDDVYITIYKETIDGVIHVYYLEDIV